jgi:hypothetical protein
MIAFLLIGVSDLPCLGNAALLDRNYSHGGLNCGDGFDASIHQTTGPLPFASDSIPEILPSALSTDGLHCMLRQSSRQNFGVYFKVTLNFGSY